jgi:hypothetical protein
MDILLPPPLLVSVAWIWDVELTLYLYVFAPDCPKIPRGTSPMPIGLVKMISHF